MQNKINIKIPVDHKSPTILTIFFTSQVATLMYTLPPAKSDSRYVNASNWTVQYRPQNNKRNLKKKEKLLQVPCSQMLDFAGVRSEHLLSYGKDF